MIQPPTTYSEWTDVLDALAEGRNDEEVLEAMQNGTLAWQSGVAVRFADQFMNVLNSRMKKAKDTFDTQMSRARGQERAIVQGITGLRRTFRFLQTAASIPCVPDDYQAKFRALVQDAAAQTQQSLEQSARNDRTGRLAAVVRRNRVDN